MSKKRISRRVLLIACSLAAAAATAAEMKFAHHVVENWEGKDPGSWGQTGLMDVDGDGDLDFFMGRRNGAVYCYEYQAPDKWVRHQIGDKSPSDVGATFMDVDGDGLGDVVLGGVWLEHPGKEWKQLWPRHVFDAGLQAVHDVVQADVDGDGKLEIVTMSDRNNLRWYDLPADPTQPWPPTAIGKSVHAGIGAGDLDGDGDVDVVRSTAWFENQDKGKRWVEHRLHPKPWPDEGTWQRDATRGSVVDVNRDGKMDVVSVVAEVVGGRVAWFESPPDPRGGPWKMHLLPQADEERAPYHSLAIGDFDNDGDTDIFAGEMESIPGKLPPRWFIWENTSGKGAFREHVILDANLGTHEVVAGDVDGDGDLDLVGKPWRAFGRNAVGGRLHVDYLENLVRQPAAGKAVSEMK